MVKASRNNRIQPQRPAILEVISSNDPAALFSLLYSTAKSTVSSSPAVHLQNSISHSGSSHLSSQNTHLSTANASAIQSDPLSYNHDTREARFLKPSSVPVMPNSAAAMSGATIAVSPLPGASSARRGSNAVAKRALAINVDINVRDELGMTPLHHAVGKNNLQMVELLLEHPKIDVNLKDLESGWTALHRALYFGYLRIALVLLAHKNIDPTVEDKDRNTATDLYLASIPSTLPKAPCPGDSLYTWGSNSNFTLGHNDGDDRAVPELVKFPYHTSTISFPRARTARAHIYAVSMEKFHTAVATSESGLAVKIWGYGSGGRLGSDKKMQSRPSPVQGFTGQAALTALGRDHTLIITTKGEVYTFGNNKYGQLGYTVDSLKPGQDPVHLTPKKVIQGIAKVRVVGAAASKWHTVVHSETELYTWGFNYGQLGHERKGDIQATPRRVVSIPSGRLVMQVAASDSATACLLSSNEVIVYHNFGYHRVAFPLFPYPDSFKDNYHTVMNANKPTKIASCDNKFGAMTGWGDVFIWQYPEVDADITLGSLAPTASSITFTASGGSPISTHIVPDPRRVWVYGGDRTGAVDFALGQNGAIILLTKGGHVYIGTNRGSSIGRNVKWRRVQHLDRVVQVQANSSGAWAAIRSEAPLQSIVVRPNTLGRDLEHALTLNMLYNENRSSHGQGAKIDEEYDEYMDFAEDPDIWRMSFLGWKQLTQQWDKMTLRQSSDQDKPIRFELSNPVGHCPPCHHLFDVDLRCGTRTLGAHRIILAARSPTLRRALVETPFTESRLGTLVSIRPILGQSPSHRLYQITLHGVEFAAAALLTQFLYSDRIDPFWDTLRLSNEEKTYALKVRQQLYHLALELALPTLQAALQYSFTHRCQPSLSGNLRIILDNPQMFKGLEDVAVLLAAGARVLCHQIVLAQRSPVFYALLAQTDVWTRERQSRHQLAAGPERAKTQLLELDMKHIDLETMQFIMQFIYTDCGPEMFDTIEKEDMMDLIQVVVNVLQIADELMLGRLKDICEHVLGQQVRPKTLVPLLEIAYTYSATALHHVCLDYLCQNLESVLDQKWLLGVDDDLLTTIEDTLIARLNANSPFVRTGGHLPEEQKVLEMRQVLERRAVFEAAMAINDAEMEAARSKKEGSLEETPSLSPSREFPVSALPLDTLSRNEDKKVSGQSVPTSEWPDLIGRSEAVLNPQGSTLSSSYSVSASAPQSDKGDELPYQPKLPVSKKTGWDTIGPGMEGADRLHTNIIGTSPLTSGPKPSLRDILEQEHNQRQQRQQALSSQGGSSGLPKDKTVKLSQKERRKLQQQQAAAAIAESTAATLPRASATQAWGKVALSPAITATLSSTPSTPIASGESLGPVVFRGRDDGNEMNGKHFQLEQATPSYVFDPSPQALTALLEAQAHDLLLLTGSTTATPRSADLLSGRSSFANGKPLTVTASSPTVSNGSAAKAPTPSSTPSSTATKEAPWRRDAIPEPLWNIQSPKDAGGSVVNGLGSPLVRTSSLSSSTFAASSSATSMPSTSAFALIQNQQLRDRNQLLLARQHKKPLFQIQLEEQAIAQLRLQALDSIRGGTVAGTGEWFSCELGS